MGENKALVEFGGLKLFERAAAALQPLCARNVTLVGNGSEKLAATSQFRLRSIPDIEGPASEETERASIIGVCSALADTESEWSAILACDLPFVTTKLIEHFAHRISGRVDAVVPLQSDGRPQPLCAVYNASRCIQVIERMLERGERKLSDLLSRLDVATVTFPEIADLPGARNFYLNVNHPEDLDRARVIRSAATA
jgi:molybdopterin-guanine dinucleotide biosynthesis protein A